MKTYVLLALLATTQATTLVTDADTQTQDEEYNTKITSVIDSLQGIISAENIEALQNSIKDIKETTTEAKEKISEDIDTLKENIKDTSADAKDKIKDAIKNLEKDVKDAVKDLKKDVREDLKDLKEDAMDAYHTMKSKVRDDIKTKVQEIKKNRKEYMKLSKEEKEEKREEFSQYIKDKIAAKKEKLEEIHKKIEHVGKDKLEKWEEVSIVQGILKGSKLIDRKELKNIPHCVKGDLSSIVADADAAVNYFKDGGEENIKKGLDEISELFADVKDSVEDCFFEINWDEYDEMVAKFHDLINLEYEKGKELKLDGEDLYIDLAKSINDFDHLRWGQFGKQIGEAAKKFHGNEDKDKLYLF